MPAKISSLPYRNPTPVGPHIWSIVHLLFLKIIFLFASIDIGRTKPCVMKQQENQHQSSEHQQPCVEHFDKHLPKLLPQHHELSALYQLLGESKLQEKEYRSNKYSGTLWLYERHMIKFQNNKFLLILQEYSYHIINSME